MPIDFLAGELRRHGRRVKLQKQPFQVLQTFVGASWRGCKPGEPSAPNLAIRYPREFDPGLSNAIKRMREAKRRATRRSDHVLSRPSRAGGRFIGLVEIRPAGEIKSLAVLPLVNLSADPEHVDGLTEALITNLAKINALKVTSRTSAIQYKSVSDKSVREIARELGVDGIVEGMVLRSGDRMRISAQLINAATDTHLWAEEYERDLRDILKLQSAVARPIGQGFKAS